MANNKAWFRKTVAQIVPTTSQMALQTYNIDFTVELRKIAQVANGKEIPYYFASTRTDNDVVLGIVGHIYRLMQNTDAFSMCDDLVTNGIAVYVGGGQFGQGERVWLLMKRPDTFDVVAGDTVSSYIGVFNSHDGNSALFVMPLAVRDISDTTLNVSFKTSTMVKIKHTTNIKDRVSDLVKAVHRVEDEFKELEIASKKLVSLTMTDVMVDDFLKKLLKGLNNAKVHAKTLGMQESILRYYQFGTGMNIPGVYGTGWAMFNAVCEWADYDKPTRVMDDHSDEDTQRAKSILFGDGQAKKQMAMEILLEMYEANLKRSQLLAAAKASAGQVTP